ncbi:recombinase family protein [Dysosmobacter sp.]|uniref:recombinase family protein n=1 Tax=Dysosmobacter sp. TaxID=2591382 RepID=UPI002A88FA73|nr:recombinase family protein [Dysosmobacter sp.]MDY3282627.1 recombinase family protein [Dysosmobacter sp.]
MRIAAYCRVSTGREEQLDSLSRQKQFFETYAARNGYELYGIYPDEGISGRALKNRREFQRMLADAEGGCFDMIVVKDVSRFARNTVDALTAVRRLRRLGVEVLFLSNNMTVLGQSEFVLTMFSALAQEESANLSARVKFGKRVTGEQGRTPTVVYGYDHVDNLHLRVNPREAETVRYIFEQYVRDGWGCRRIAQALNDRGIPTKKGNLWDARGVGRILRNSIYCGEYVNCKYQVADFLEGRLVPAPPGDRLCHRRPEWAVVPPELFRAAQRELALRQRPGTRYSGVHLFSGLIRCGVCGRVYGRKDRGEVLWRCPGHDREGSCPNRTFLREEELKEALRRHWQRAGNLTDLAAEAAAQAGDMAPPEELRREAERFLNLETMTNPALRTLLEGITIREDRQAEIVLRPLQIPGL